MDKKTKICNACEAEWEEDFFCDKCSSDSHYEEVEIPNDCWDGSVHGEEFVLEEEWISNGDICLNCCICHHRNP
ncbi:MAG: hypothetical protein ACFFG0_04510 [Candidatus Thorarchaeota archaeon]